MRTIDGHTVVTTGAGADLVLVSSLADAADGALSDPTGAVPGGDVDGINGFLDIDAGGAADRLVVDDSGETADDIGRVTSNEISGLGMTVDPTNAPADAVHVITVRDARGRHLHDHRGRPDDRRDRVRRQAGRGARRDRRRPRCVRRTT